MDTLTEILGLSVHDMGNDMEQKTIEQHRTEFEDFFKVLSNNIRIFSSGYSTEYRNAYLADLQEKTWQAWKAARGIKE